MDEIETNLARWITGADGAGKVCSLYSKWQLLYLHKYKIPVYNPIESLCAQGLGGVNPRGFVSSPMELRFLKKVISNEKEPMGAIGVKGQYFEVHKDILNERPNAENLYKDGRRLLEQSVPWLHKLAKSLIHMIVPIKVVNYRDPMHKAGFSSARFKGAIFYSFNRDNHSRVEVAIDLAHELGHQSLFCYQTADSIILKGSDIEIFSPIKGEKRPAIMTFHALAALSFMRVAAKGIMLNKDITLDEKLECERGLIEIDKLMSVTVSSLATEKIVFTEIGNKLFKEFKRIGSLKEDS